MSSYFRNIKLKQTPSAVRQRVRLLTNDEASERQAEAKRANSDRAKMTRVRGAALFRAVNGGSERKPVSQQFLARVRHHLSRGRTPADIVVRENVLMSVVESAVEQVRKEVAV